MWDIYLAASMNISEICIKIKTFKRFLPYNLFFFPSFYDKRTFLQYRRLWCMISWVFPFYFIFLSFLGTKIVEGDVIASTKLLPLIHHWVLDDLWYSVLKSFIDVWVNHLGATKFSRVIRFILIKTKDSSFAESQRLFYLANPNITFNSRNELKKRSF